MSSFNASANTQAFSVATENELSEVLFLIKKIVCLYCLIKKL